MSAERRAYINTNTEMCSLLSRRRRMRDITVELELFNALHLTLVAHAGISMLVTADAVMADTAILMDLDIKWF